MREDRKKVYLFRRLPLGLRRLLVFLCLLIQGPVLASSSIDLSQTVRQVEHLKLSGPWDFYWGVLLGAQDEGGEPTCVIPQINITWNKMQSACKSTFPIVGRASYRVTVEGLVPDPRGYFILLPGPIGARRLLVTEGDNRDVLADYTVGVLEGTAQRDSLRDIVIPFFPKGSGRVVITVQLVNLGGVYGGLIQSPSLSLGDRVLSKRTPLAIIDIFALSVGILVGIYNLGMFLWNRSDKAALYLSIAAFFLAIRIFGTSYLIRNLILEDFSEWLRRFEFLPIFLASYFLFLFLQRAFPAAALGRMWEFLHSMLVIPFTLLVLMASYGTFSQALKIFQLYALFASLCALFVLFRALRLREPDIIIAMAGFCLVILTLVWDIVFVSVLQWGEVWLIPFGVSAFFSFQSYMIMLRAERSSHAARELAEKNADIQKNLLFETEERLILAANVAHHINNPLNYIQVSKDALAHSLKEYQDLLKNLLGEDDAGEAELYQVQQKTKEIAREAEASLTIMTQGLKRASKAVSDIRMLSGIDGNAVNTIAASKIFPTMLERLHEVESPIQLARLQHRIVFASEHTLLGNEAVLIHSLEFFVALALEHSFGDLQVSEEMTPSGAYRLCIGGELRMSTEEQEQALKRLQHIVHSNLYSFELTLEASEWSFVLSPVVQESLSAS